MANQANRPEPFSVNFQRETQALLFLLHWKQITSEELRINLKKMGVELVDAPRPIPRVPMNHEVQLPDDESYPVPEEEEIELTPDVAEILNFIEKEQIAPEEWQELSEESFENLEVFKAALAESRGE